MSTEIVDMESLDVGAVILLGTQRREWRILESEPIDHEEETLRVRLAPVDTEPNAGAESDHALTREFSRTAKFEVICG